MIMSSAVWNCHSVHCTAKTFGSMDGEKTNDN